MNTALKISWRYLFAKKKSNAINIISRIAMLAFAVCTAALIIILSTMNGFESLIFSMYSKFNPDVKISLVQGKTFDSKVVSSKLNQIKNIKTMFPVIEDNAVIRNGDYQTVCTIKGVDSNYLKLTGIDTKITEGDASLRIGETDYVVLGAGIDHRINASINGPYNLLQFITPKRKEFSVSDPDAINHMEIEASGVITMDESINNKYVFVPKPFAEKLFDKENQVSYLELNLLNNNESETTIDDIKKVLGSDFKVLNRVEQQASLYKMFRSEKWASYAILTFILLIAAFNALGSLTMLVIEKKKDIATMMSYGANTNFVRTIFLSNGLFIAMIGSVVGMCIGILLVYLQEHYGLVKMHGAIVENYPVKLLFKDVLLVGATAMVLGVFTGFYPAMKASAQKSII